MSGIDATRKIKEVSPSTKVVIMTAHDEDRLLVEAVEAGASGFLGKDEAAEELLVGREGRRRGRGPDRPRHAHATPRAGGPRARRAAGRADAPERPHRSGAGDPPAARRRHAQRRHRHQALHQPADRADPRPQHPGEAARALEARGRRLRRQARRRSPSEPPRGDTRAAGMQRGGPQAVIGEDRRNATPSAPRPTTIAPSELPPPRRLRATKSPSPPLPDSGSFSSARANDPEAVVNPRPRRPDALEAMGNEPAFDLLAFSDRLGEPSEVATEAGLTAPAPATRNP